MRYQPANSKPFDSYLDLLVSQKQPATRDVVELEIANILARAEHLVTSLTRHQGITQINWNPATATALVACYESSTEILRHLKDDCLESLESHGIVNLQLCPYCMLNQPDTWDHFLPKSRYPEFSVFNQNLVYVCWSCNHKKADDSHEANLLYLHPSYTVDSLEPILHCDVTIPCKRLAVEFRCDLTEPEDERTIIARSHVSKLDLFRRYQGAAARLFSSFVTSLARDRPGGVSEKILLGAITRKFEDVSQDLGPNAWEARFWHGALRCVGLTDYVNLQIASYKSNFRQGIQVNPPPAT